MAQMKLWELGFQHVAGVDEAGRGPLAGPVVAAACIIPASVIIPGKINNFCVMASGLETSCISIINLSPCHSMLLHFIPPPFPS